MDDKRAQLDSMLSENILFIVIQINWELINNLWTLDLKCLNVNPHVVQILTSILENRNMFCNYVVCQYLRI